MTAPADTPATVSADVAAIARADLVGRLRDDALLLRQRRVDCKKIGDERGMNLASQFVDDLDEAAYVLARAAAQPQVGEDIRSAAQFLSDRLDDLEWVDGALEDTCRNYMGHVDPAHSRLKKLLAAVPSPVGEGA